jgi:MacB-like periplasmic core domain
MAAFAGPLDYDFSGNGPASMAQGQYVSGDLFSTLGVNTIIGRPLGNSDDSPSAPPAIVLSYAYWQRAFGAERSVVGRMVRLNNISTVIVGVAEPRFTNLTPGKTLDFFMPFSVADRIRSEHWGHGDRISDPSVCSWRSPRATSPRAAPCASIRWSRCATNRTILHLGHCWMFLAVPPESRGRVADDHTRERGGDYTDADDQRAGGDGHAREAYEDDDAASSFGSARR